MVSIPEISRHLLDLKNGLFFLYSCTSKSAQSLWSRLYV